MAADRNTGKDRQSYASIAGLKKRGWTPALIRDFLGEPDKLGRNPYYASAPSTKLYLLSRVDVTEKKPEFMEATVKAASRSAASRAAAERKRAALIEWAENVDIKMPSVTIHEALRRGFDHWRRRKMERYMDGFTSDPPPKTPDGIDYDTRLRWARNWLRHCRTDYEKLLNARFGVVGAEQGYAIIRRRVDSEINRILRPKVDVDSNETADMFDSTAA